jgi:hypothetical protein
MTPALIHNDNLPNELGGIAVKPFARHSHGVLFVLRSQYFVAGPSLGDLV